MKFEFDNSLDNKAIEIEKKIPLIINSNAKIFGTDPTQTVEVCPKATSWIEEIIEKVGRCEDNIRLRYVIIA